MAVEREALLHEIERLRARHLWLLEEVADALEAPAAWEHSGEALCWRVLLEGVLEPDVDVEVLVDAVVVRAAAGERVRISILPLPRPFRAPPAIEFRGETLVVRVRAS